MKTVLGGLHSPEERLVQLLRTQLPKDLTIELKPYLGNEYIVSYRGVLEPTHRNAIRAHFKDQHGIILHLLPQR
ncbi:MAG: hypothetical protein A2284_13975 [Deltaproteobacteria bacterium RIFOXYA12_FULL_61_11]|nr:MAG: hypothetical protein A2284_13975 [Deltaproteobacteria bacterium RIFOXYA12_FULL_61_11]